MSLLTDLALGQRRPSSGGAPPSTRRTPVPEFDFVLFGATGDLATRKLLPSLAQREAEGVLPPRGRIICLGRRDRPAPRSSSRGRSATPRTSTRRC